jgi:hypothetical protein
MIAAFIAEKINRYVAGGMAPDTAAKFTRGELSAIYKGNHYSRDGAGKLQKTTPPEALGFEAAMKRADAAIAEIKSKYPAPLEKPRNVYHSSDAIKQAITAGLGIKAFFAKSGDNDPEAYSALTYEASTPK